MASPVVTPRRLPGAAHGFLGDLYTHRLMSTSMLHELWCQDKTVRWVQMTLAGLERQRLVARAGIAGRREVCWYLTSEGHRWVESSMEERRPYRMSEEQAVGPLQAHTLLTNAIGLAFRRWSLARGDVDFGGWSHEVAHPLGPGKADRLLPDAVMELTIVGARADTYLARFIEADRATEKVRLVGAKLESYSRLARWPAGWSTYPRLPAVLFVIAGAGPAATARRIAALRALAGRMTLDPAVRASACSAADLEAQGPFARIWSPLLVEGPPTDLLGA